MPNTTKSATATMWPGWIRLSVTCAFIAICGLAFWSTTVSRFVASELGETIAEVVGAVVGLLMAFLTYFDPLYAHDTPERAARLARAPVMGNVVVRTLCVLLMTSYLTFEAMSGAALQFWTLSVGHPGAQTLHIGDYWASGRRSCAGFSLLEAPFKFHRVICVHYDAADVPSPGTPVRVYGTVSDLGVDIAEFEIAGAETRVAE